MKEEGGAKSEPGYSDEREIIGRMQEIAGARARPAFRLRVYLCSVFPGLIEPLAKRRGSLPREGTGFRRLPAPVKAAAVVLALFICILSVFGALSLAARNSRPGDALYFVKRAREALEVAFAWGSETKAYKNLDLAERRLAELGSFIGDRSVTPRAVQTANTEFETRTKEVAQMLVEEPGLADAGSLAARLNRLLGARDRILSELLSSAPESMLEAAAGAQVTVTDSTGNSSIEGSASKSDRADGNGSFSFRLELDAPVTEKKFELVVKADGREAVLPLGTAFERRSARFGDLIVRTEQEIPFLYLDRPQLVSLTVDESGPGGRSVRELRLKDTTGTCLINGRSGEARVTTDTDGHAAVTLTKTALSGASRIQLQVPGSAEPGYEDFLILGGLKYEKALEGGDAVRCDWKGPATGPSSITLENGLVSVTVENKDHGHIISKIEAADGTLSAGPLFDPQVLDEGIGPSRRDLRLIDACPDRATYRLALEYSGEGAALRKTYDVTLARANRYATVACRLETEPAGGTEAPGAAGGTGVVGIAVPAGADLKVSGEDVTTAGLESPLISPFGGAVPYVSYRRWGEAVFLGAEPGSAIGPYTWVIEGECVSAELEDGRLSNRPTSPTFLVGFTESGKMQELLDTIGRVSGSASDGAESAVTPGDGFLVREEPEISGLRAGRHRITLHVYKRYRCLLSGTD